MGRHKWPPKDPDEILDYVHDWSDRLDGDEITGTPTATVDSGTITVSSTSTSGALQTVWLSGGTAGTTVLLLLTCSTVGGRTYQEGISINIRSV